MNAISRIRAQLGVTQSALAEALNVTQGNISHYERGGQAVPPVVAKRLITFAGRRGVVLTFDDIYAPERAAPGHGGRQPPSTTNILDTIPAGAVVVVQKSAKE